MDNQHSLTVSMDQEVPEQGKAPVRLLPARHVAHAGHTHHQRACGVRTFRFAKSRLRRPHLSLRFIADSVIVPVTPKYLDAKGLELLLRSIADIREFVNPSLDISGILLTMADTRTNFTKQIINIIEQAYGENIRIFKEH